MRILRSWLEEFVALDGFANEKALIGGLTRLGIEVEEIEHFDDGDFALGIEVTPDRSDLLCHFGIAREIAAMFGKPLKADIPRADVAIGPRGFPVSTETDGCPRYCGLLVRDVTVRESSERMKRRLERVGLRPISNVVDATNYILMELNHPVHAFDLDRLSGRVFARDAVDGETIRLLDGVTRELRAGDIVIADEKGAVALGGVMGGESSSVTSGTSSLLLEAAWFEPSRVRKTARRLGISTDSSYRFERTADIDAPPDILRRLARLIVDESGGRVDGEIIDAPLARAPREPVTFRRTAIRRILGCECAAPEKFLIAIGCDVRGEQVTPPSWRSDLNREIDFVEEIARYIGYENIPSELPPMLGNTLDFNDALARPVGRSATDFRAFRARLDELCRQQGLDRCCTFSFEREEFGEVAIHQPLNAQEARLRRTILPALCRVAQIRLDKVGVRRIALFEIDKVFGDSHRPGSVTVTESMVLAALVAGIADERRYDGRSEDEATLDHALGLVREIARVFGLALEIQPNGDAVGAGVFGSGADVVLNGELCGRVGPVMIDHVVADRSATSSTVRNFFGLEIDLVKLFGRMGERIAFRRYRSIPRYPAAQRDLAFQVAGHVVVGSVLEAVHASGADHIEDARLFDIFTPKGKSEKSIGVRLTFRSGERTLTDAEIGAGLERIVATVERNCGAKLRSGS